MNFNKLPQLFIILAGLSIPCSLAVASQEEEIEIGGRVYSSQAEEIRLESELLRAPIPETLGKFSKLKTLTIYQAQLKGHLPPALANLTHLEHFNLAYNKLTGSIPSFLGQLTNLKALYLTENRLTGPIPGDLKDLINLEILYVDKNQLSGEIPDIFESLTNLRALYLSENQLTGSIPHGLRHLINLEELDLAHNQLTGPIPDIFTNLNSLQALFLNNNQLSGIIPEGLGNLNHLDGLDLSCNQLTGFPHSLLVPEHPLLEGEHQQLRIVNLAENSFDLCRFFQNDEAKEVRANSVILGLGGEAFNPLILYKIKKTQEDNVLKFSFTNLSSEHPFFAFNNTVVTFDYSQPQTLSIESIEDKEGKIHDPTPAQIDALQILNQIYEVRGTSFPRKRANH